MILYCTRFDAKQKGYCEDTEVLFIDSHASRFCPRHPQAKSCARLGCFSSLFLRLLFLLITVLYLCWLKTLVRSICLNRSGVTYEVDGSWLTLQTGIACIRPCESVPKFCYTLEQVVSRWHTPFTPVFGQKIYVRGVPQALFRRPSPGSSQTQSSCNHYKPFRVEAEKYSRYFSPCHCCSHHYYTTPSVEA